MVVGVQGADPVTCLAKSGSITSKSSRTLSRVSQPGENVNRWEATQDNKKYIVSQGGDMFANGQSKRSYDIEIKNLQNSPPSKKYYVEFSGTDGGVVRSYYISDFVHCAKDEWVADAYVDRVTIYEY